MKIKYDVIRVVQEHCYIDYEIPRRILELNLKGWGYTCTTEEEFEACVKTEVRSMPFNACDVEKYLSQEETFVIDYSEET